MDLQKERELFLAHMRSIGSARFMFELDEDGNFDDMSMSYAWSAWQAAKAQSDKKIKLLLCDEHLKKCESPTGIFNSQYPDEEPCLICLVKQAKAQAVPEGFVLVPHGVLDLTRFMCKTWSEIDKFVYKNCSDIGQYPVIQGTQNQLNLSRIGEQQVNANEINKGVNWLLEAAQEPTND